MAEFMPITMNACRRELEELRSGSPHTSTKNLDALVTRPRVGVGCIMLSSQHPGCLLIGERKGSHGAGRWALPGGHLEQNESFADCATKEIQEECGIVVSNDLWHTLFVSNDPMPEEDRHYVTIFQIAHITEEQVAGVVNAEPDKCCGWEWVQFDILSSKPTFIPLTNFLAAGGVELIKSFQARR